jgi:hypothetical protein
MDIYEGVLGFQMRLELTAENEEEQKKLEKMKRGKILATYHEVKRRVVSAVMFVGPGGVKS